MNDQRIRFSNVRWAGVADRARMGGLLLLACAGLCAGPSAPAAQFVPLSSFGALYDSFSVRGPYGSVLVSGTNLLGVAGAGMSRPGKLAHPTCEQTGATGRHGPLGIRFRDTGV